MVRKDPPLRIRLPYDTRGRISKRKWVNRRKNVPDQELITFVWILALLDDRTLWFG